MAQKKILFLVPYPLDESPSQRFRFEQYLNFLESSGNAITLQPFLNSANGRIFYNRGSLLAKAGVLLIGFVKRLGMLFTAIRYDLIFIHREAAPVGPPVIEWVLAKVLRRKFIYDFDDAIWLTDRANESMLLQIAKCRSKVSSICRWSYRVSCGNQYLREYASQFNADARYIPTTIDTEGWHNPTLYKKPTGEFITIGWTGSHSTLKYLKALEKVLKQIESAFPKIKILVIADREPDLNLKSLQFLPWNKHSEIEDLLRIDIGIMPLPDDEWANGKCGFKALQYMALKIPCVISPVGVNSRIVDHGTNGFLASTTADWLTTLEELIHDATLRTKIGEAARLRVVDHYSVLSTTPLYRSLFE
ncbi:MAG: glycosyltransferase family 4 protein [Cyclobacteriaceae bacterium]|nr:glycosyltransferase family 4 protein [Cyclobacteriaceae bacterium]